MSVLEGVSLLVNHGWSTSFVLDECPLELFGQLVLVAQKQKLQMQQMLGVTVMSALGSLFSKKAGSKLQEVVSESLENIDSQLAGDVEYDPEEPVEFPSETPRRRSKPTRSDRNKVERMWRNLHGNFSRLTGRKLPSVDAVLQNARKVAAEPPPQPEKR